MELSGHYSLPAADSSINRSRPPASSSGISTPLPPPPPPPGPNLGPYELKLVQNVSQHISCFTTKIRTALISHNPALNTWSLQSFSVGQWDLVPK